MTTPGNLDVVAWDDEISTKQTEIIYVKIDELKAVSYTHLDVYKRQSHPTTRYTSSERVKREGKTLYTLQLRVK